MNRAFKARFRRRTFHVPSLIPIRVDSNELSSAVDSDVEPNVSNQKRPSTGEDLCQLGLFVIYALDLVHEKFDV